MELREALDALYYSSALCDLKLMNRQFEDRTVTYNSLLYLELIFFMKGRCTASKIAELLCISKPAVTLKINELMKQGLVKKTPDPADRRQNLLSVNEEAMPNYQVYRMQDDLAVKKISEKFSEKEIKAFCEMLHIVSEINFREMGEPRSGKEKEILKGE